MDDRAFWIEVRRWLLTQQQANASMIRAIEARLGLQSKETAQEKSTADTSR
jgi:hypothetical protein